MTQTSYPFWVAARARRKDASFSLLYPFLSRWREEGRAHAHGRTWEAGRQRKAEELARGGRGRRISQAAPAAPAADGARARQGPRPAELARGGASLRGEGPEGPRQRGDASWWGGRVRNRAGGRALVRGNGGRRWSPGDCAPRSASSSASASRSAAVSSRRSSSTSSASAPSSPPPRCSSRARATPPSSRSSASSTPAGAPPRDPGLAPSPARPP